MDLVGVSGSVDGITVREFGTGAVRQTEFTFVNAVCPIADGGAFGIGNLVLATLPLGVNFFIGATGRLTLAFANATDANLVGSIGTAAAATDGTLTSTEANIAPSTACAIASGVGTLTIKSTAALMAAGVIDGSSSANVIRLNFATSTDPVGTKNLTLNGKIVVTWLSLGDATGI
jgi:hypothetical protein